jgi:hypothetical protein
VASAVTQTIRWWNAVTGGVYSIPVRRESKYSVSRKMGVRGERGE